MTDKLASYILIFALFLICVATCYLSTSRTITVKGEVYRHIGFVKYQDDSTQLYIPVYRRQK
jgi:hypothetical protein